MKIYLLPFLVGILISLNVLILVEVRALRKELAEHDKKAPVTISLPAWVVPKVPEIQHFGIQNTNAPTP